MAFKNGDIFSVMADEICRGARHIIDAETPSRTADDGLAIIGRNSEWLHGWKTNQRPCRMDRQKYLAASARKRLRQEISESIEGKHASDPEYRATAREYAAEYYQQNKERILAMRKAKWEFDPEFRARSLARKAEYRKSHPEVDKAIAKKYRDSGRKKNTNVQQAKRAKAIRRFIREMLCDECLVVLHDLLMSN
jgi:hypothetical protein